MTTLQKQLAVIAAASTHQLDLKAQKVAHGQSLLFEPRVAASQSFENLFLICYEGYRDLCALDPRFLQFSQTLFSEQSKVEDRTQKTQSENNSLNRVIESFLIMIGPRLLLKPAEKALEWLVRRFRVHEYSTESLVFTYLPYHDTPQFLALLSILPPNPTPAYRFLHPYIKTPTNVPRRTIIYTAINTPAFFNALQSHMMKVLDVGYQGSRWVSFWSGVTTQSIDGILDQTSFGRREVADQKMEELLLRILPVLMRCLKKSSGSDVITACYMIIIVLVTKTAFDDKVLDTFMEAIILSHESDTTDAALMCLAVVAEERSAVQLPPTVVKGLLKFSKLNKTFVTLSKHSRVDRLMLGCALGALESMSTSEEAQTLYQETLESNLLDGPQLTVALSALLQALATMDHTSARHAQLADYASRLSEQPRLFDLLRTAARRNNLHLKDLGVVNASSATLEISYDVTDEDEEILDPDAVTTDPSFVEPPDITERSFLDNGAQATFKATLALFEQALTSNSSRQFLQSKSLQRDKAFQNSLYLSFLARTWCSAIAVNVRTSALRSALALIKDDTGKSTDLQHLIPYLLYALADPSAVVRRFAAACIAEMSTKADVHKSKAGSPAWGSADFYGSKSSDLFQFSREELSALLSCLIPVLEECTLDPQLVITFLRMALEGSHSSKSTKNGLKSTHRGPILSFLAKHLVNTPLLCLRLRLLPLFYSSSKIFASTRVHILIPLIRAWSFLSPVDIKNQCELESINALDAEQIHMAAILPREAEGVNLLRDIISGNCNKERMQLSDAAFDRLVAFWLLMRSDARLTLAQRLLDLSLDERSTEFDRHSRNRSRETLRSVRLDSGSLLSFLDSIPSPTNMPEGPPAKKRRRTSRNEIVRAELESPDDITRVLRRLTLVLELIETSQPEEHPQLLQNLFIALGDLQQLKQRSGSDLVYLQSLILASLTPIVKKVQSGNDAADYESFIRADLLIDCIRHSPSPQVQNGSLLLIAALASWVPELILHNLMPVFTFLGSTLLREQDDYSAHVVDQTISRVVPQLASSLRAKHKSFLTGVADLLLSFTAAFEHIPSHRRLKLFSELARTLGPEDALPAIIALLADRYPGTKAQPKFSVDLLLVFEPFVTLLTLKGFLDLVEDAAAAKRKVAETLFSLNEKSAGQVENALSTLLSALVDISSDVKIRSHVARVFRSSAQTDQAREIFATMVQAVIRISKLLGTQSKPYHCCSQVLSTLLDLLPTTDLIKSAELLLETSDRDVRLAAIKSVELRAGAVVHNDKASVSALMVFLPILDGALQQIADVDVKRVLLGCIDSIIARFGKRDTSLVSVVAETVSGSSSLSSTDDRVRILSILCLSSIIDVLEDEAISLLPTVLPTSFEYLGAAIEEENEGLHNAVFALLSNTVQRLGFLFSREYLEPVLKLSLRSAIGGLSDACDEERVQFMQVASHHLDGQEVFEAVKSTWVDAIELGSEALEEQLDLIDLTVGAQTKPKLLKASPVLFGLLLEAFKLRPALEESPHNTDVEDLDALETKLIDTVLAMTLKLNDATFRPFFAQLVDQQAAASPTFYRFLTAFFEKFKSIVTPYAAYVFPMATSLLTSLTHSPADAPLRTALLTALTSSFTHDHDTFWHAPSRFSTIVPPLLAQLTLPPTSLTPSCLIPAIVALAAAPAASTDHHREMNAILLRYMRADEAGTRLATVRCERALTKRLGEEWLGLLPEMLPFVAELREDGDELVERETVGWIGEVEGVLGESLEGMLS